MFGGLLRYEAVQQHADPGHNCQPHPQQDGAALVFAGSQGQERHHEQSRDRRCQPGQVGSAVGGGQLRRGERPQDQPVGSRQRDRQLPVGALFSLLLRLAFQAVVPGCV